MKLSDRSMAAVIRDASTVDVPLSTWTYRLWLGFISLSGYTWRTEITSRLWPSKPTKHFFNNQEQKGSSHIGRPWNTNPFKKKILTITWLTRKLSSCHSNQFCINYRSYALDMHRNEIRGVSVILLAQIETAVKAV